MLTGVSEIEHLIDDRQWARLAEVILQLEKHTVLRAAAGQLKKLGETYESAGNLVLALRAYQYGTYAMARRMDLAPNYEERRRRWDQADTYGWTYGLAHRKYQENKDAPACAEDGTPITADAIWEDGWKQLRAWAIAGEFERCRRYAAMLDGLKHDDGDRDIRNAGIFEDIGDQLKKENKSAARWFYEEAAELFDGWVSSASSGGEGIARSRVPNSAERKLKRLDASLQRKTAAKRP